MNFNLKSIPNDVLMWGGLAMLAVFTVGLAGRSLNAAGTAVERFGDSSIVGTADKYLSNFAWSEGMPWRDRSIWYQWKSDFGSNNPTRRLTVA